MAQDGPGLTVRRWQDKDDAKARSGVVTAAAAVANAVLMLRRCVLVTANRAEGRRRGVVKEN